MCRNCHQCEQFLCPSECLCLCFSVWYVHKHHLPSQAPIKNTLLQRISIIKHSQEMRPYWNVLDLLRINNSLTDSRVPNLRLLYVTLIILYLDYNCYPLKLLQVTLICFIEPQQSRRVRTGKSSSGSLDLRTLIG